MTLEQQIQEDIKAAMKAKDTVAMNATRAIKEEILLFKTSEGGSKEVTDADIQKMIQKLVKQRKEAAEQFVAAGRQELADNELSEASVMEKYLPKQLSEAEVEAKVREIIAAVGATSYLFSISCASTISVPSRPDLARRSIAAATASVGIGF